MLTGVVKYNGQYYYLQEIGTEIGKLMANTNVTINGIVFVTDEGGKIVGDASLFENAVNIYDMDLHIFTNSNVNANGEVIPIIGNVGTTELAEGFVNDGSGIFYYMETIVDENGQTSFRKATGIRNIGGSYYYFDENGVMAMGLRAVDGILYYFQETGDRVGSVYTGYITINGESYFCDPENGGVATRIS